MKKLLCLALVFAMLIPACGLAESAAVLNTEGELPIVNENITLSVFGKQGAIHADWSTMDFFIEYQKMTGITLDFQTAPAQGYDESKALMFASGEYADMLVAPALSNTEIVRYGEEGVLIPLEDLLAQHAPNYTALMEKYPEIAARITAPDGHIYALAAVIEVPAALTDKIWCNKAWLEALNLEVPTTLDELHDVLVAFKGYDANGNGEADEIPLSAWSLDNWLTRTAGMFGLQYQFGQRMNLSEDGATLTSWLDSDEFKALLQWSNTLYAEGLLDPEIFTQESATYNAKMSGQMLGMFFCQADDSFDSTNYVGIAPFSGASDTIYVSHGAIARDMGTFAITSACKYPEAAIRWIDYLFSAEGSYLMRYGIEGKTWTRDEDGYPVYVDGILNNPNGSGPTIAQFTIWPGGGSPQYMNVHNCAAVTSEATLAAQEALDPYMNYTLYAEPLLDSETNERLQILLNDINTYVKSTAAKLIRGEMSFDEWDAYCSKLSSIGVDEMVSIYQAVLDSY
ncbi:MAG: extracellular solute-binding protein [Aristaeellaceae bacterium]